MGDIEFDVSITRLTGATVLFVRGEVDGATAPALRLAIAGVMRAEPKVLVIDLQAVTFLASAGLLALVEAAKAAPPEVRVVAARRECLRPIHVTGLDTELAVRGTLAEALKK
jgi:anti-anti-sigma factor